MGMERISVYSNPWAWPPIIIAAHLWQNVGYGSIVYFAAITSMDAEVMEAASIDGANKLQKIRYITLPLLKPTFVILFLFSLGGILKGNFGLFYNIVGSTNAALFPVTDIIETYVFRLTMNNFNFSLGAATSLYQSVFVRELPGAGNIWAVAITSIRNNFCAKSALKFVLNPAYEVCINNL